MAEAPPGQKRKRAGPVSARKRRRAGADVDTTPAESASRLGGVAVFKIAWTALKKAGWTSKKPSTKCVDSRYKYIRPGGKHDGMSTRCATVTPKQLQPLKTQELELNVEETLMTSLAELPGRQLPLNVDDKDLGMAAPITQPQALQRCVYRILATKGMTSALIKSWKTSVQGRRTLTTERSSPCLLCTNVVHVVGGEGAADVEGVRFVGRHALRAQQEVTPALLSWQTTTWRTLMVQRARQVSLCLLCARVAYVVVAVCAVGAADVEGVRFVGRQALRAQQEVTPALLSWQTTSWLTLKEKQTRQVWLCLVSDSSTRGSSNRSWCTW
ncbi:hypothetical protein PF004_g28321 [Phytophthora fragariae]|uniref:Uncharacterized protein n=1 Tax=Phytophthora fragariae TaxID=53985 RepID=A0A6G0MI11_9STRA|nr:hypothetical protein PF004_g28321 [Phytophthora fragariae]